MAKSDSFFIRARVTAPAAGTYNQIPIDLGSYVDALGKSVLRIHNISVVYQDAGNPHRPPQKGAGVEGSVAFQLTTQSRGSYLFADDRSLVSSGFLEVDNVEGVHEASNLNPMHWTNGYLIAVESLYLAAQQASIVNDTEVSIVLECTVETMTQAAAIALSLSQQ